MDNKSRQEVFIMLLLFILIIFTIIILFYDCFPTNNKKIKSAKYTQDDDLKATMSEVQANGGEKEEEKENSSLLRSYSITKEDLSAYASDSSYQKGKKDPFAENSEPITE